MTTILTGLFVGGIAASQHRVDAESDEHRHALRVHVVCIGIPILRMKDPTRERGFRVPFGRVAHPDSRSILLSSDVLLAADTWWLFIGWLCSARRLSRYGYTRSSIGHKSDAQSHSLHAQTPAFGFLLLAVGLFPVPHELGLAGASPPPPTTPPNDTRARSRATCQSSSASCSASSECCAERRGTGMRAKG